MKILNTNKIFLIRHTSVNIGSNLCYGQSNVIINPFKQEELEFISKTLQQSENIEFYSSPLSRCTKLVEILSENNYSTDSRLLELNFGDWELKKWSEIDEDELKKWGDDFVNRKVPNGESYVELQKRVVSFLYEITKKNTNPIAIITHGGVIRGIISHVLGFELEKCFLIIIHFS